MKSITITQLAKEYNTTLKDVKEKLFQLRILEEDRKTLTQYAIENKLGVVDRLPVKGKYYQTIVYDNYEVGLLLAREFMVEH